MCLAAPGKIKKIKGNHAEVDFNGIIKKVNIFLTSKVKVGDYVVVHTGFSIQKLIQKDAFETLKIIDKKVKTA